MKKPTECPWLDCDEIIWWCYNFNGIRMAMCQRHWKLMMDYLRVERLKEEI